MLSSQGFSPATCYFICTYPLCSFGQLIVEFQTIPSCFGRKQAVPLLTLAKRHFFINETLKDYVTQIFITMTKTFEIT
jgi:hypothetical protein